MSSTDSGTLPYSSRGFFTEGTNFGNTDYPEPPSVLSAYSIDSSVDSDGVTHRYYKAEVRDTVTNTSYTVAKTRASLFDAAMARARSRGISNAAPNYAIDRVVFDDQARTLIPRAVGYSAGLLGYFFRGSMKVSPPAAGFYGIVDHADFAPTAPGYSPTDVLSGSRGFNRIKLRVVNTTPPITPPNGTPIPQAMSGGALVAIFRFHRNECYDDLLITQPLTRAAAGACRTPYEEIAVSAAYANKAIQFEGAATPEASELEFVFPAGGLPINATDVKLQVDLPGPDFDRRMVVITPFCAKGSRG